MSTPFALVPANHQGEITAESSAYRPMQWPVALDQWVKSLDSTNTQRDYSASLISLFGVPGMPDCVCEVTATMLLAWRGAMVARSHLPASAKERISAATVNRHLSAARSFFNYWRALSTDAAQHVTFTGDAQRNALKRLRSHVEKPFAILNSDAEIAAILDAASGTGDIETGKDRIARDMRQPVKNDNAERDTLIITVALGTGLRCAELAALNVGSLIAQSWYSERERRQKEAWFIHVKAGKGNKGRQVEINAEDAAAILAYIQSTGRHYGRPDEAESPLFLSQAKGNNRKDGGRLFHTAIRRIIDRAADRAVASGAIAAGKVISPHSLRHTYAINLLRGDESQGRRPATIMEVSKNLGHASVIPTQRYVDHINELDRAGLAPAISRLRKHGYREQS